VGDGISDLEVLDTAHRLLRVLQFIHACTSNFADVSKRATGTAAGRFLSSHLLASRENTPSTRGSAVSPARSTSSVAGSLRLERANQGCLISIEN
jgi:hypothetical protein